jgi:hypothetical protein
MAPNMGKFMGKNGEIYWKIIGKNIGKIMGKSSDKSWEIWDLAGKYGEIVGI